LRKLAVNPRPKGCRKLKGFKNQYRIRVGIYRAIYSIEDELFIVEITKIGDRKDIY
jgi:mRNA interferase RelE/StbE